MTIATKGLCVALLVTGCGTAQGVSDEDAAGAGAGASSGNGGAGASLGGAVSEHDAGEGPAVTGGGGNVAGSPAGDGGAASPGDDGDGILVALDAALGNSAIALQDASTTAFWPEAATDENDEWLITVLGGYDGTLDDGAATGHYLATQPTSSSLTFELEAATSAASYRSFVGPSWLTIHLKKAGASGFRVEVTCSEVEVQASGTGASALVVGQNTGDTANGSLFCVAAAGDAAQPFSQPSTSFDVKADPEGYGVMSYVEVTAIAATFAGGGTASAKAKVHLELAALP